MPTIPAVEQLAQVLRELVNPNGADTAAAHDPDTADPWLAIARQLVAFMRSSPPAEWRRLARGQGWLTTDQESLRRASTALMELGQRITTIADEAFGPFPVQSPDENLTAIERGIFEQRQRLTAAEQRAEALLKNRAAAATTGAAAGSSSWTGGRTKGEPWKPQVAEQISQTALGPPVSLRPCKPGCGDVWYSQSVPGGEVVGFCSKDCKDAGRPLQRDARWWLLVFLDFDRAPNDRTLGACLVEAASEGLAIHEAERLGCHPGGHVGLSTSAAAGWLAPAGWRNRMISREEFHSHDFEAAMAAANRRAGN